MCLTPVYKKNPYYAATDLRIALAHNVEDEYLACPCGHCPECRAVKQSNMIQRMETESKYNHLFFATLTYDDKHLPVLEVEVPLDDHVASLEQAQDGAAREFLSSCPDGFISSEDIESRLESALSDIERPGDPIVKFEQLTDKRGRKVRRASRTPDLDSECIDSSVKTKVIRVRYADIHHLQLMFKRMRDNNQLGRPFRYLAVTERGKANGRPHVHIIFLVPKRKGDDYNTCETLNAALKDMLLKYWSTNIGTRKNPVYERNFTYRQRWIGRKLYRNFDCHYVNPNLRTEGISDVAFYVTKYIYKDSPKEEALQQMLALNIKDKAYYSCIWDIVKSRYVASKGLGLDGCMFTLPKPVYVPEFTTVIERVPVRYNPCDDDLPPDADFRFATSCNGYRISYRNSRVLVPNPELVDLLRSHALDESEKGFAIYVGYNGKHIPLGRYYRERILTESDRIQLYFDYDPVKYPPKRKADALSKEEIAKLQDQYSVRVKQIDAHENVDARWDEIETRGQNIDPYSASYRTPSFLYSLTSRKTILGCNN